MEKITFVIIDSELYGKRKLRKRIIQINEDIYKMDYYYNSFIKNIEHQIIKITINTKNFLITKQEFIIDTNENKPNLVIVRNKNSKWRMSLLLFKNIILNILMLFMALLFIMNLERTFFIIILTSSLFIDLLLDFILFLTKKFELEIQ